MLRYCPAYLEEFYPRVGPRIRHCRRKLTSCSSTDFPQRCTSVIQFHGTLSVKCGGDLALTDTSPLHGGATRLSNEALSPLHKCHPDRWPSKSRILNNHDCVPDVVSNNSTKETIMKKSKNALCESCQCDRPLPQVGICLPVLPRATHTPTQAMISRLCSTPPTSSRLV